MKYKAFYRTYRPNTFDEVRGQDNIVLTLKNIIKMDKVSHAYLFCGPRGTGKTSVAKIFANTLNCIHKMNDSIACQICVQNINNSLDIIEIDAASNNGVNEIRDLREKIKFMPTKGKYKIYIVDEVHMLSKGAFNALLKTLEEPPAHVIFIFATTDPDKLPLTILSRVQRYNFSRISKQVLIDQIESIMNQENIKYEKGILEIVAILASGSLRDALSIIDQANAFSNSDIKVEDLNKIFALASYESQIQILNFLAQKNIVETMKLFNDLFSAGLDIKKFVESLISLIKNTIIYKKTLNKEIIDFENIELLNKIKINPQKSYLFLSEFMEVLKTIKYNSFPKEMMELSFIKICSLSDNLKEFSYEQENAEYISNSENKDKQPKTQTESLENIEDSKTKIITDNFSLKNDKEKPEEEFKQDNTQKNIIGVKTFEVKTENTNAHLQNEHGLSTDELLNETTNILNTVNDSESINNDISESIIKEDNTDEKLLVDTSEMSLEEVVEKPDNKQNTQETSEDIKETNSFEMKSDKNYTNEINVEYDHLTEEVFSETMTQPAIINLFLQSIKEDTQEAKNNFKLSIADSIGEKEFESFIDLMHNLRIIAASPEFILFATEKNFLVEEINSIKNTKAFRKYIYKSFGKPKHVFVINKMMFLDSRDLWNELKEADKLPEPKKLPPLFVEDFSEDDKQTSFIKKGNELFGSIFKKKK